MLSNSIKTGSSRSSPQHAIRFHGNSCCAHLLCVTMRARRPSDTGGDLLVYIKEWRRSGLDSRYKTWTRNGTYSFNPSTFVTFLYISFHVLGNDSHAIRAIGCLGSGVRFRSAGAQSRKRGRSPGPAEAGGHANDDRPTGRQPAGRPYVRAHPALESILRTFCFMFQLFHSLHYFYTI